MRTNESSARLAGRIAIGSVAAAASLGLGVAGQGALAGEAVPSIAGMPTPSEAAASVEQATTQTTKVIHDIQGTFAWDQGVQTSTTTLARNLYGASRVLCGSQVDEAGAGGLAPEAGEAAEAAAEITEIAVSGDVATSYMASVEELEEQAPVKATLGCTCAGNPADGLASANAAVEGFELQALIAAAQPLEGANTITFVCADGYEVAMPLFYVQQHRGIVVTALNGERAVQAVGCANQLWLGSTSARSFARDIVEIRITAEENPPAAPGVSDEANQPNVGVVAGA